MHVLSGRTVLWQYKYILMKIVKLQMLSTFKEMVVAHLRVLYQNSPEETEEDDKNSVWITDNAVKIRSRYLPT